MRTKLKQTQTGIITVITAISILVLIAIGGAGIDLGHFFVNKTRAQNLVDALALGGAKTLDDTNGNTQASNDTIAQLFNLNMSHEGNEELSSRLAIEDVAVQYSQTLSPFVAGASEALYIRVSIDNIVFQSWFIKLLQIDSINIAVSAISGPSSALTTYICDVAPMLACGDPGLPPDEYSNQFWGYSPGVIQMLKSGSSKASDNCVGPGNFQLINVGQNPGGNTVRHQMAGNIDGCHDVSDGIDTKPGNTVGPAIQGLNTRFNIYQGPLGGTEAIYPPDVLTSDIHQAGTIPIIEDACVGGVTSDLSYSYVDYQQDVANSVFDHPPPEGKFERRVLRIPIGDCDDASFTGQSTLAYLGTGCFFLLKQIQSQGGQDSEVFGEFIEDCTQNGGLGPDPNDRPGSYKIILYKDTTRVDA